MNKLFIALILSIYCSSNAAEVSKEALVSTVFDKQYNCSAKRKADDKSGSSVSDEVILSQDGKVYSEIKFTMITNKTMKIENYMVADKEFMYFWQFLDGKPGTPPFKKPLDKSEFSKTISGTFPSTSYTCSDTPPDASKLTPPTTMSFSDPPRTSKKKK